MKKILLFLFVLLSTNMLSYSQIVDPIRIKNEIKESLAIHMLLLKNNVEELKEFLEEYKYIVTYNEEQIILSKKNVNDHIQKSIPSYYIVILKKPNDHIQSRLVVVYSVDNDTKLDYSVGVDIYNSIINSFSIDCPPNFKCTDMWSWALSDLKKQFTDEKKKFSIHSEYAFFLHSENDANNRHGKPELFRATNFMKFNEMDAVLFCGPGKQLTYLYPVLKENEDGSVFVNLSVESLWSEDFTTLIPESFDYSEFMSFENLNDKIW